MLLKNASGNRSGFTLVEIVVSTVIIGIAILAVVTVIRKSREIDITYVHHHKARALIDSCFEDSVWQYANYDNFTADQDSVLIDARSSGGQPLKGHLSITLALDSTQGTSGDWVKYQNVTATIAWPEPEGTQTVTCTKAVPEL
jgi:prepilin-type N-terminal cleavage/methylation domain-containing protein